MRSLFLIPVLLIMLLYQNTPAYPAFPVLDMSSVATQNQPIGAFVNTSIEKASWNIAIREI